MHTTHALHIKELSQLLFVQNRYSIFYPQQLNHINYSVPLYWIDLIERQCRTKKVTQSSFLLWHWSLLRSRFTKMIPHDKNHSSGQKVRPCHLKGAPCLHHNKPIQFLNVTAFFLIVFKHLINLLQIIASYTIRNHMYLETWLCHIITGWLHTGCSISTTYKKFVYFTVCNKPGEIFTG